MTESAEGPAVTFKLHLGNGRAGHRKVLEGSRPKPKKKTNAGVPRVAQLLALAHHFDDQLRADVVKDYAEIARLMNVTRAWVTQIMNLLFLAPDIQREILFLTAEGERNQPVSVRRIRNIMAEPEWKEQRRLWRSFWPDVPGGCPLS